MTNPYSGTEPYETAWNQGHDYGGQNPGSDQPTPPDFSGWGYDAATAGYIGQVWQEGVLAGRSATSSPAAAAAPAASAPAAAASSAAPATSTEPASSTDAASSTAAGSAAPSADAGTQDAAAGGGGAQVQYHEEPRPGPVAVVGSDGNVVEHGHASELQRAGQVQEASHALEIAVQAALAGGSIMPGIGPLVQMVEIAHSLGCTVAVGLDGELAAVVGADAGSGVYYTPSGQFGLYVSLAADLGAVLGASISEAVTVVHGGAEALAGNAFAVTASGGEGIVGSGSALFSMDGGGFIGVAGSIGLGVGWPIGVFAQFSHTWIKPVT